MKKRKRLIESSLDNPLSSAQKVTVEEIISLFPQISPRAIVAETLRIFDAAQQCTSTMKGDLKRRIIVYVAIQKFATDSIRDRRPVEEFKREIVQLRKELADRTAS